MSDFTKIADHSFVRRVKIAVPASGDWGGNVSEGENEVKTETTAFNVISAAGTMILCDPAPPVGRCVGC